MAAFTKPEIVQASRTSRRELSEDLIVLARDTPVDDLPALIGILESAKAVAWSRLTAPAPIQSQADELIDVSEAAKRLGISEDYLYRHHKDLAFTRHAGRKLLFSARGIEQYISQKKRF